MADAGQEHQLSAHILGSLSHLALHTGHPQDAITFALQGQERLAGSPNTEVTAWLLALQARGHAALHQHAEGRNRIREAELAHAEEPRTTPSPWVNRFDNASLATEVARGLFLLGDLQAAQQQIHQVMPLRPRGRTRSRAFARLMWISILITQGKPDEACSIGRDVLDETTALSSYLVLHELQALGQLLAPYQASPDVRAFTELLRDHLHQHQWLVPSDTATALARSAARS